MIFIVVKWPVRPEASDDWPTVVADFTAGTRAESGNLFFDWFRSVEDPDEWVLVEGFRDAEAGAAHVESDHFRAATEKLADYLRETPKVISVPIAATDWSDLAEIRPTA